MKILVCHPGHSFSTHDVYMGLCEGLRLNGIDVVRFQWGKTLELLGGIVNAAIKGGGVPPENGARAMEWASFVASADLVTVALDADVDAVIVVNGLLVPPSRIGALRRFDNPIACIGTEAPYFLKAEQEIAPFYTHWFTNERLCVGAFPNGHYLPHAYNPATHQPGPKDADKQVDAVFIGGGYPERQALLAGQGVTTRGTLWHLDNERGADDHERRQRYAEGAIPNTETTAWHRSAKVSLNLHRKMAYLERGDEIAPGSAESLGPRAYEIPAVGGFELIDDERPEVRDVFGDSAATFRAWDRASLRRALDYWRTHDDARERQQRAQAQAIAPHHWGNRAKTVLETIL